MCRLRHRFSYSVVFVKTQFVVKLNYFRNEISQFNLIGLLWIFQYANCFASCFLHSCAKVDIIKRSETPNKYLDTTTERKLELLNVSRANWVSADNERAFSKEHFIVECTKEGGMLSKIISNFSNSNINSFYRSEGNICATSQLGCYLFGSEIKRPTWDFWKYSLI